jgi:hypothetical protein
MLENVTFVTAQENKLSSFRFYANSILVLLLLIELLESNEVNLVKIAQVLPIDAKLPCFTKPDAPFVFISNASWRLLPELNENVDREVLRLFLNGADEPIHMPWKSVRQCLIGRRISFVGDSVTRYQYLNLVHFITHGRWYSSYPSLEWEGEWSSWVDFYRGTSSRLVTANGLSRESCDCYRSANQESRENRYYENSELNLIITYHQFFWGIQSRGMDSAQLNLTNCTDEVGCTQSGCSPGNCTETQWIARDHMELLEHVASTLHPDTIIFNSGIWHRRDDPNSKGFASQELINDLLVLSQNLHTFEVRQLIWKTTTFKTDATSQLGEIEMHFLAPSLMINNFSIHWKVFDAYTLTSRVFETGERFSVQLYEDTVHLKPEIYRSLNEVLLIDVLGGCKFCHK